MAGLAASEIAHYQSEGWVVPRFAISPDRVARMCDVLDHCCAITRACGPRSGCRALIEGDNGAGVRGSRRFLELARNDEIVNVVSAHFRARGMRGRKWQAPARPFGTEQGLVH